MANDVKITFHYRASFWFWIVDAMNGNGLAVTPTGGEYQRRRDCVVAAARVLGIPWEAFITNKYISAVLDLHVGSLEPGPWKPGASRAFLVRR